MSQEGSWPMILHCTLVSAPGSVPRSAPVELSIDVPPACSGSELQAAISRRYGTGELTVDSVPLAAMNVVEGRLLDGAILVDGSVPQGGSVDAAARDTAPLVLTVHSGPGAGLIIPLRRGRFRIGRSGPEVVLPDAELSRTHAQLDVTDSAVTFLDLDSVNGVSIDGRKVHLAAVSTASLIRCGGSTMSVVFSRAAHPGIPAGAGSDVSAPLVVANPVAHGNKAAVLLAAGLPLALGVGLALLTGLWIFLAFTVVSAVTVLVPVVAGRRQRRTLRSDAEAATHEDKERRRRAAPSAGELSLRCLVPELNPVKDSAPTGPVWLRLGLADQCANVRLEPPDAGFRPRLLGPMPVTIDPATPVTTLRGPDPAVAGLLRFLVLQLACYPAARRTRILIHGPAPSLLAARFLAAATLSAQEPATLEELSSGFGPGYERGVLIVNARGTAALRAAAVSLGWQVVDCTGAPAPANGASIVLTERTARFSAVHARLEFRPDLVPAEVFDRNCRRLRAGSPAPPARTGVPQTTALNELLPLSGADIVVRWSRSAGDPGLRVPVGVGPSGTLLQLDLTADGPHFLVAGTTGSGKSEFLRTLAAALAAAHPPDRVNLLFIDFKGGSGLRPLAGLSHCVGLLTDLAINEVARALVSLRAEVRRRESLLAAHRAADLRAYETLEPAGPPLPHLVLIIDEFRMLVDDAPAALAELMRIAAIGRSLGIHLVMATQRPQGAVSADIRANVTSCIALRVQSELESFDIINSRLAAAIPVTSPGHAYLVRGNENPAEFQTATIAPSGRPVIRDPTVMQAQDFLQQRLAAAPRGAAAVAGRPRGREDAELTQAVNAAWQATGGDLPRRPVAAPLPKQLPFPPEGSCGRVRLGLLDIPEEQRVSEFGWTAAAHGHLGLIAGTSGGSEAVLGAIVKQLLGCLDEPHVYILDSAGLFTAAVTSPRVGAVVGLHELRRAVRVLERFCEEMALRLGNGLLPGMPALVLALCGWGSWVSALRAGPLAWAEDLVHDIVRDGARAGITVLVSGERELVSSRFFASIPNRIFLPAGATDEARLAWPTMPAMEATAGRVVVLGPLAEVVSAAGHVGQLFEPNSSGPRSGPVPAPRTRPFRVEPLPRRVTVSDVIALAGPGGCDRRGAPPAGSGARTSTFLPGHLRLGLGGDELLPAGLAMPPGAVLTVLGGTASGKTALLSALPGLNPAASWLRARDDPERYWIRTHGAAESGALDPAALLLADDLDLQSAEINARLLMLNNLGWRVILTAGFGQGIRQRVPVALNGVAQGRGVLIAPRGLADGELFGVRFDPEHHPPPGRAVVISEGQARTVQLAFDPSAEGRVEP